MGRYRLGPILGTGGWGEVYRAHDTTLGRAVALKLLRRRGETGELIREAQVMARLMSSAVAQVFDAGEEDGRPFIAMELLEGGTLRTWLEQPRTPAEVLQVLDVVAEGVAQAHAAGIVHRDLKPENILFDREGRPKVSDFGVAHLDHSATSASAAGMHTLPAGTLAYMAPEQMRAGPIDGRVDQFAFATLAWEALTGARPFAGHSLEARQAALSGPLPEPARQLPRGVLPVLTRALQRKPELRYPDMEALRQALRRARRPWFAVGGVSAVVVLAVALALGARSDAWLCRDATASSEEVWAAENGGPLTQALQTGSWAALGRALRDYRARLAASGSAACRASVDRGEGADARSRRGECIAAGAEALRISLSLARNDSLRRLGTSSELLDRLPDPSRCELVALPLEAVPPSPPAAIAAQVHSLRASLAEVRIRLRVLDSYHGKVRLEELRAEVERLGWKPLLAELRVLDGIAQGMLSRGEDASPEVKRSEALLLEGLKLAEETGDERLTFEARLALARFVGHQQRHLDEMDAQVSSARALWERLGKPPALQAELLMASVEDGHESEVMATRRQALALEQSSAAPSPTFLCRIHIGIAYALAEEAGQWGDDAMEELRQAQAALRAAGAESSPRYFQLLRVFADAETRRRDWAEAKRHLDEATALLAHLTIDEGKSKTALTGLRLQYALHSGDGWSRELAEESMGSCTASDCVAQAGEARVLLGLAGEPLAAEQSLLTLRKNWLMTHPLDENWEAMTIYLGGLAHLRGDVKTLRDRVADLAGTPWDGGPLTAALACDEGKPDVLAAFLETGLGRTHSLEWNSRLLSEPELRLCLDRLDPAHARSDELIRAELVALEDPLPFRATLGLVHAFQARRQAARLYVSRGDRARAREQLVQLRRAAAVLHMAKPWLPELDALEKAARSSAR